jgi:hypothetical protein
MPDIKPEPHPFHPYNEKKLNTQAGRMEWPRNGRQKAAGGLVYGLQIH